MCELVDAELNGAGRRPDPLALIARGVELLAGEDPQALDPAGLSARVQELGGLRARLDGQLQRAVAAFDAAGAARAEGAVSTQAWLTDRLRVDPGEAAKRIRVAHGMAALPDTAAAVESGRITLDQAAVVARTAEELGTAAMTAGVEHELLAAADHQDPAQLGKTAERIRHRVEPDGLAHELLWARRQRRLAVRSTPAGMVAVDGLLDRESGEIVLSALMPLTKPRGDNGTRDLRTGEQRMADALVDLARIGLASHDLPDVHGEKPHLSVLVPLATLQKQPGADPAELAWTGPVSADTARRLACDAQLSRVLIGPAGEPLDVGRAARTETPAIRRALVARDRGCRFSGCGRPAAWTTAHHIKHWATGGPTVIWNLVLLCHRHHMVVHEAGWAIGGDPNSNELCFVDPDGRRHPAPLPGAPPRPAGPPLASALASMHPDDRATTGEAASELVLFADTG